MSLISRLSSKAFRIIATLVLMTAQMAPVFALSSQSVSAAQECTNDQQGANDFTGQKDLTLMCADTAAAGSVQVKWQWDDIDWSGNNSGDACALFDTDADGKANNALCVVINGAPATLTTFVAYSCSDSSPSRCGQPATSSVPANSSCTVSTSSTQPFLLGSSSPDDTLASCTINLNDVGGSASLLIDVCSYPSQQPNSSPSDCIIFATSTPSTIEIKKTVVPSTDSGYFNLQIDGVTAAAAVHNGGTTGKVNLAPATYTVGETGASGTDLSGYTTGIVCLSKNGSIVAQSTTVSVDVVLASSGNSSEIVCTITNTRKTGNVKVVKDVINDNGGTKTYNDFNFKVGVDDAQSFNGDPLDNQGYDGVKEITLPTGTYAITEPEANSMGYSTSYSDNCASLVVVSGQTVTCTITNDDVAPKLTINKIVQSNHGGNATVSDFSLTVGGNAVTSGDKNSYSAGTAYTINETQTQSSSGYSFVSLTGDPKCPSQLGGSVTLELGDDIECTITNADIAPQLWLEKVVVNDNGGTLNADNFGIEVSGLSTHIFGTGIANGTMTTYKSGSEVNSNTEYTISEADTPGYSEGIWSCDSGVLGTGREVSVTLDEGQIVTCSVTNNDDAPTLTLIKIVTSNYGGNQPASAWTLIAQAGDSDPVINQQGIIVPDTDSLEASTPAVSVWAGVFYTLSESDGPFGYSGSGWVCEGASLDNGAVSLALAANVTCTITNNDLPAKVSVVKYTNPCMTDQLFNFTVTQNEAVVGELTAPSTCDDYELSDEDVLTLTKLVESPADYVEVSAGTVTVEESVPNGWFQDSSYCYRQEGDFKSYFSVVDGSFDVVNGGEYVCEFTNIEYGEIVITKYHDYDEDGMWDEDEPTLSEWDMCTAYLSDGPFIEDVCAAEWFAAKQQTNDDGEAIFTNVRPGAHAVAEVLQDGWTQSAIQCELPELRRRLISDDVSSTISLDSDMQIDIPTNIAFVPAGEKTNCYVGNYRHPQVQIDKSNNKNDARRGDEITFTLTITVPEASQSGQLRGAMEGTTYLPVTVTDFLTNEFNYVPGSFTAQSSVRGDLKAAGITTDPNYASPGKWTLTTQASNIILNKEIINLTFRAIVGATTPAGLYTTQASVIGYGDTFNITASATDPDEVRVSVPAVLGASTTAPKLASTGVDNTNNVIVALSLIGIVLFVRRKNVATNL